MPIGGGSETNNACVITNTGLGRKTYVMHPSITPSFSVLDPELTVGLPAYPTATCGFDVLTHALEAFVSVRANAYSDAMADPVSMTNPRPVDQAGFESMYSPAL